MITASELTHATTADSLIVEIDRGYAHTTVVLLLNALGKKRISMPQMEVTAYERPSL